MDDPFITEMDPVRKLWMFQNWVADKNDQTELAKSHAYLLASFSHPEAVRQLLAEGNVFESSEEDFEESFEMVRNTRPSSMIQTKKEDTGRRKRRTLKE